MNCPKCGSLAAAHCETPPSEEPTCEVFHCVNTDCVRRAFTVEVDQ